ncbi:4Fe-4S dicluster domain-containing protein [uncultured Pseudodesulfovibrio sp.]|uniref:4Fe-4S dicluster domain-containing protein n=1 Tax=uncultured Pseudodesulfovibrio sp. TaxID=2035858 RepID=UPI0029C8436C|nr:4Fe-4S dicluster domain-containing protein [uncultured Pseudodesulfovibrio sp.]
MSKTFLIDTSRCTACRGCQLACKEWHGLPANKTLQWGSHQNPPDLNPNNYKLVRFHDYMDATGTIRWNFFPDQCRHCEVPPCKEVGDVYLDGAILKDEKTGAVLYTEKTKQFTAEQAKEVQEACPYNIPRRNDQTGLLSKCTMCFDRITNGLPPSCVRACPTGTMNFGERADMLKLAEERLALLKKKWPKASLGDPEDVNVIYLMTDTPDTYHEYAVAEAKQASPMTKKQLFAKLASPIKAMKA